MNKLKLSFKSEKKQDQFFTDQLPMLIFFYERVCIFGSISAVIIFALEFLYPIGFGEAKYVIICLPILFLSSFKLIKVYPRFFNYILPINNLLIGSLYNINLLFGLISDLNLMIGQTVVLVQFSLLLGSNFLLNLSIIIFNFTTLILVQTLVQKSFNGNQVMLILAIILSCLSYYSSEYMKREFFLLKQRDDVQYGSLIEQFGIELFKIKYDRKSNLLKLETQNNCTTGNHFLSQEQFRQFLRQIQIPKIQKITSLITKTPQSLKNDYQMQTSLRFSRISQRNGENNNLEQFLHKQLVAQIYENHDFIQGYDSISKCDYKIKIMNIIEKGEFKAIVLLQQNDTKKQLNKLKYQRDYYKRLIEQFQLLFEVRIKQICCLINKKFSSLQQLSKVKFNIIQFINEYFSICINKNDYQKLNITTINMSNILLQIEQSIQNYLKLKQIQFSYLVDYKLTLLNDSYLLTHVILSQICQLIQKSPKSIYISIYQHKESEFVEGNVQEIKIEIIGIFTNQFVRGFEIECFDSMMKKILKIIGPNGDYKNCQTQNQQITEIKYEFVIYKNLHSLKTLFQKGL